MMESGNGYRIVLSAGITSSSNFLPCPPKRNPGSSFAMRNLKMFWKSLAVGVRSILVSAPKPTEERYSMMKLAFRCRAAEERTSLRSLTGREMRCVE